MSVGTMARTYDFVFPPFFPQVFLYHLFDDTVMIHEPPQRNLGIVTGRFLEKGVYLNQETGRLFAVEDFKVGNIVRVFNHEFTVLGMDEYTRKNIEGHVEEYPSVDLQAVLERLRESLRQQNPKTFEIFRRFDTDKDGVITLKEFNEILLKFNYQLSVEEAAALMRFFDKRRDGQISYNEFCDAILDKDYTEGMLRPRTPLRVEPDPAFQQRAIEKVQERAETERVRRAVREVGGVIYQHFGVTTKVMKELCRMSHLPVVSKEAIRSALLRCGFAFEVEDIERAILFVMPHADVENVDYFEFLQVHSLAHLPIF